MLKDLVVAWRTLFKKPGYFVAVIATLGLGIGASAMTFSLLDAALLRPLPFERPDRLVTLVGLAVCVNSASVKCVPGLVRT